MLRQMAAEGLIVKVRGNRNKAASSREVVTGKVQLFEEGFGFVIPEKEGLPDLFLPRREIQGLVAGDRVQVRVTRRGARASGSVIRLLERAHPRVAGRLERGRRFSLVHPYGAQGVGPVRIPQGSDLDAPAGTVVLVEITSYPTERTHAFGRVTEILGDPDHPDVEFRVVALSHGLSTKFPRDVEAAAAACPKRVGARDRAGRSDLRAHPTITIDGETARDFDDAVHVQKLPAGRFRLWVSIADVAHYVGEGEPLDREAHARGTSVYFPDRAIPMLPTPLSSGICSLNPDEDRLALTVEMDFDAAGRRSSFRIYESVLRSHARTTYTDIAARLGRQGGENARRESPGGADLQAMEALARRLVSRRMEGGSIDFDLPEAELILDVQGRTEDIVKRERNIAHRIIEEFMLQANQAVAEFLADRGAPLLYRIHEEPEERDIREFAELVKAFGFNLDARRGLRPKHLADILSRVKGRPEEYLINQVMLRSMRQARYSPGNAGHFGLAFDCYCHFTSPIRRYPDLVNHRILKEVLRGGSLPAARARHLKKTLPDCGTHTSRRERIAVDAERDIVALKKAQFMAERIGEEFEGFVSGVTKFGFFVELSDFFVEGLVPLRTLQDDDYLFRPRLHQLVGRYTKRSIGLGDRMQVLVDAVDLERRRINFAWLGRVGERAAEAPRPPERGGRARPGKGRARLSRRKRGKQRAPRKR
jgi:ribonuclease R